MMYELSALYSNVKSYYHKAEIEENEGVLILYSYGTKVAEINTKTNEFSYLWEGYSATTARHINEFLQQNGFCKMSKAEILQHKC